VLERLAFVERRRRAEPLLGEAVEVGAPPFPGSRRRHADEVDPDADSRSPDPVAERLRDLGVAARPVGQESTHALGRPLQLAIVVALHAPRPRLPLLAQGEHQRPEVATRDDVDRVSHQRRLHEAAPLERAGQRVALEALQPRPEPDVRGGRVLRLEAADLLHGARQRQRLALEQELAGQQRAVQVASGEDALGHARHANGDG
jgi:hypothetical protein